MLEIMASAYTSFLGYLCCKISLVSSNSYLLHILYGVRFLLVSIFLFFYIFHILDLVLFSVFLAFSISRFCIIWRFLVFLCMSYFKSSLFAYSSSKHSLSSSYSTQCIVPSILLTILHLFPCLFLQYGHIISTYLLYSIFPPLEMERSKRMNFSCSAWLSYMPFLALRSYIGSSSLPMLLLKVKERICIKKDHRSLGSLLDLIQL